MPRKRKVPVIDEEKENEVEVSHNSTIHHGPMYTIMSNVQLNETFHKKYIREMQLLYAKMDHDAFMFTFIKMIKSAMVSEETNEYAYTTLLFCAKFIAAYDIDDTHPVLVDTSRWLLSTISQNPHIRFRLCQFVNMILNALGVEAALDDAICDSILDYMLQRLRDINPNVRVQAILALQRLQCPDNPDDVVLRVYQFHLSSDPSPRVRQAVITSMGRNYNTIPYILDRLWDIDEKVRRHTYLHMSGYPVKAYKVSQRLQLLEQGLNDRSEMVKKVVTTIMLPQWLESYNKNYIMFVSALKLDASEAEVERFIKIAKVALHEIFKRQEKEDLVKCVPFEEDSEFHKCVPHEKLTVEVTLYWQCLIEHLQAEMADELDMLIPELSTFCAYVLRYCESQNSSTDKFMKMEFQYVLLSLCQILYLYDLGDEIGRENLKKLISTILKNNDLEEKVIEVIVKCTENLITDQNTRLQFFVEIIEEITQTSSFKNDLLINDRNLVEALLEQHPDKDLKLKLSSLKVKILDLEEQEMNYVEMKDYVQAHRITEEKNVYTEEYSNLLKPLLEKQNTIDVDSANDQSKTLSSCYQQNKKVTSETVLKSLQLAFYMVVSKNVKSLTPNVCKLYNEFIGRHIASNQIAIRDWALKCGTAYSMLYESLAKEIYEVLYAQFFKNHNIRIWKTSITCIFELLDRYGCSSFNVEERQSKNKRTGRQLYNTLEFLDADDDSSVWSSGQAVDIIFMMSHFLDTCDDVCIISAIVNGFCRLILHDHIKNSEVLEKLLLRYFNPSTDPEINQILGVFLENLIQRKKQEYLHPCVLPTISQVISAPYESPLHEIKPETILRFVIDSTRPECCAPNANIHNKLALSFLQEMQNNIANKDLCKILSKELLTLEMSVVDDIPLKENLKSIIGKLIKCEFDSKTLKNIIDFKDLLDGVFNPPLRHTNLDGSDEEEKSDDETVSGITTEKEFDKAAPHEATAVRLASILEEDKDSEAENLAEMVTGAVTESQGETVTPQQEDATEKATEPETASSQASVSETTKEPESEKEPETEKESETEKEPEPSTEPLSQAAPSTPVNTSRTQTTPTTFGRENSTGLRYLRKSMNFSRSRLTPDDGPSPKIRIEARIDSLPSPAKVQKMNENARQTRKNLRTMIRGDAAVPGDVQQSAGTDPRPTRENRKAPTARPASTSKKASKKKEAVQSEDSDDSEVIPPSPTSSAVTDTSSIRLVKKRVNRTLRYNNTQLEQEPPPSITKATRSNRNRTPANARPVANEPVKSSRKRPASSSTADESNEESVVSSTTATITIPPQSIIAMSIPTPRTPMSNRLRAKNSGFPDKSVQQQNSTRSSLNKTKSPSSKGNEPKTIIDNSTPSSSSSTEEEPTRSERVNSKPKSPVEGSPRNSSKATPVNKTNPRTPISNRLRAKNSNVPEKAIQRPKSTRSAQNKTNSPSSKENEPKSSTDSSSSSELASSSDVENESSTKTPQRISQSRIVVTKSVERRIRNDRNPVISLQRSRTASDGRVSTRNSARKDRQNNMIMTRKRLSLENVRSPSISSPARSKTPTQKKATAVVPLAPPKTSKIPVNLALRSIKTNSKQKSSQHNSSGESSKSSSSDEASSKVKAPPPSKPVASSRIASLAERRAKPTLAASTRIMKSTRQMDTKTMLRKRNI